MLHIEQKKNYHVVGIITTVIIFLLLGAGGYLLLLSFAPSMTNSIVTGKAPDATQKKLEIKPSSEDRLYIPQINVDVAIVTGSTEAALEKGAWHRKPQLGDPITGGNFILSAHRFVMAYTPQGVAEKSPFYNIDKLHEGDKFFVDYKGKRYAYEVQRKYSVRPNAVEIEDPSKKPILTLYSCTLGGSADGRDVIEAVKLGEVKTGENNG